MQIPFPAGLFHGQPLSLAPLASRCRLCFRPGFPDVLPMPAPEDKASVFVLYRLLPVKDEDARIYLHLLGAGCHDTHMTWDYLLEGVCYQ